jgi:hypothetical protein
MARFLMDGWMWTILMETQTITMSKIFKLYAVVAMRTKLWLTVTAKLPAVNFIVLPDNFGWQPSSKII